MFRTFFVAITAFFATLVVAPLVIILSFTRPDSRLIDYLIRKWWAGSIARAAGLRITLSGVERMSDEQNYVILPNHYSYLDIPVLLSTIPHQLRFMAKASLFKIPLFGHALKIAGFIPVDRKNRSTAVHSFDLASKRLRKGNSVVVFPEEGRTRKREMRPFQRGGFLLALKSGLPIVPVGIKGTYEAMPATRVWIRPGPVVVTFAEPIDTTTISVRDKDELMTRVRNEIGKIVFGEEWTPEDASGNKIS